MKRRTGVGGVQLLKKGSITFPKLRGFKRLKDLILRTARPELGGVDIFDLDHYGISFPMTIMYFASIAVLFIVFMHYQIVSQTSERFLSLSNDNPNNVCEEVPLSVSGSYFGTLLGVWDTFPAYQSNQTVFQLDFHGAQLTTAEYRASMAYFESELHRLGSNCANKPLVFSMIAYCVYGFRVSSLNLQFSSTVDPTFVFNGLIVAAMISNRDGVCVGSSELNTYISGSFDAANAALQLDLPLYMDSAYLSNVYANVSKKLLQMAPCQQQFGGKAVDEILEWLAVNRDGTAKFDFDVRTIMTAVAMNMNIQVDGFNEVPNRISSAFETFVDPWYADGMDPVWCLAKNHPRWQLSREQKQGPPICFVRDRNNFDMMLNYPMIFQLARGRFCVPGGSCIREMCQCNDSTIYSSDCRRNRFQVGLIFSTSLINTNDDADNPTVDGVVQIGKTFQDFIIKDEREGVLKAMQHFSKVIGYSINVQRAPAISNQSIKSFTDPENGRIYDNSWAKGKSLDQLLEAEWDNVCQNCSAFIFEVEGSSFLNKYGLTMSNFAPEGKLLCHDIISQHAAISSLAQAPPVNIVNSYFQCSKTTFSAMAGSVGGAIAATGFMISIFWVLFGHLVVWVLKKKLRATSGEQLVSKRTKTAVIAACHEVQTDLLLTHLKALTEACDHPTTDHSRGPFVEAVKQSLSQLLRFHHVDAEEDETEANAISDRVSSLIAQYHGHEMEMVNPTQRTSQLASIDTGSDGLEIEDSIPPVKNTAIVTTTATSRYGRDSKSVHSPVHRPASGLELDNQASL